MIEAGVALEHGLAAGMSFLREGDGQHRVAHGPALAVSALARAAPPFVTVAPSTMIVAPLRTPASSSVMSFTACRPPGVREPRSTEARLCRVTPLARSTTAGGRSS